MNPFLRALIILFAIALCCFLIAAKSRRRGRGRRRRTAPPFRTLSPEAKGARGERDVSAALRLLAQPDDQVIDDIILFNPETGKSSQIDHIFLCASGVYVIETKSHSGRIYGTDAAAEWREYFPGGEEVSFYSPVKQNKSHLYIVRKILGEGFPVIGLVVFVQGDIGKVRSDCVTDLKGLAAYLSAQTEVRLSPARVREATEKLCRNRDAYQVTAAEHLENIRKTQIEVAHNICPRCGAPLVLRRTKQEPIREFYGCSNYPQCKFTKDV